MKVIRDWYSFRWVAVSLGNKAVGVYEPNIPMSLEEVRVWCLQRAAVISVIDDLCWDPFNVTLLFSRLGTN